MDEAPCPGNSYLPLVPIYLLKSHTCRNKMYYCISASCTESRSAGEENDAHCSSHSREELKDILQNYCQLIEKSMSSNLVYSRNISFGGLLSEMCSFLSGGDQCCLATLVLVSS